MPLAGSRQSGGSICVQFAVINGRIVATIAATNTRVAPCRVSIHYCYGFMSIIAKPRRPAATNLRISIWSAFLLAVATPPLFERAGHPYYGAALLRPGSWILARMNPDVANNRAIVLLNFVIYLLAIFLLLWLLRRKPKKV